MQGGVGNGNAADEYRLQAGNRSYCAGATDLYINGFDNGQCFFGGEFMGNGPARCTGDETQFFLLCQTVNFDHHTVDFIRQSRAVLLHFLVKCQYFADILETAEITVRQAEAEFFTVAQLLQVFFCDKTALLSGDGIGEEMQFALCRNA